MQNLTAEQKSQLDGYFLSYHTKSGKTTATVHGLNEEGDWYPISQPLPVCRAVDLVRLMVNGENNGNVGWEYITMEQHDAVAENLGATGFGSRRPLA